MGPDSENGNGRHLEAFTRIWEALGRTSEIVARQGQELKDHIANASKRDDFTADLQSELDAIIAEVTSFTTQTRHRIDVLEQDYHQRQEQQRQVEKDRRETRKFWTRELLWIIILGPVLSALLLIVLLWLFFHRSPLQ